MGRKAEPFRCFINPDDPDFVPAGNIPRRIQEYCRRTGLPFSEQKKTSSAASTKSLPYPTIYIVGGVQEISRENIDRLIGMWAGYGITGHRPSNKHYRKKSDY